VATRYNKTKPRHRVLLLHFRRNVIDAAGRPRMTPRNSAHPKPTAPHNAILLNRLQRIGGTRRVVPAYITVNRGYNCPVNPQNYNAQITWDKEHERQRPVHLLAPPLATSPRISFCRVTQDACADPGNARITTSVPGSICAVNSYPIAFRRRRTRLRITAPPTVLATMNPNRTGRTSSRIAK
jgi:hypothetical protein